MGFSFQTAEERNPELQGPGGSIPPTLNCEEELKLMNQFSIGNG